MSFNYTQPTPVGDNNPTADWQNMSTNSTSIQNLIAVDHIGFNTVPGGYHNVVHFFNQAADPGTIAGVGQEYTKTVGSDQQLFYESGLGIVTQLTGPNAPVSSANGYTWLPGGVLMQWGKLTGLVSGSTGANVITFATYGIAFPNNCFTVNLQPLRVATGNADTTYILTGSVSKTGFTVNNTSSSIPTAYFIALGN